MNNVLGGFDSHTFPLLTLGIVACLIVGSPARAAAQVESDPSVEDTIQSPVIVAPEVESDDPAESPPAPMGAFFKSFILPGWGQFATDQPKRGVFYATVQAATLIMVVRTQKRIDRADENGDIELAEDRREQREDWITLAVFWSLASAVDAWVSAHMWGFAPEVVPPPDGSVGLAVQYRVPVPGF